MADETTTTSHAKPIRFFWLALSITTMAFGIRLIVMSQSTQSHLYGDEPEYIDLAKSLLKNGKFISTEIMQPCQGGKPGDPTAYRSPVFPFFLAAHFKFFGDSFLWPKLSLILASSSICILLAFMGKFIGESRAGLIAAILWAINPSSILSYYSSDRFFTEGLSVFLFVGALTMTAMMFTYNRWGIDCVAGLLLGISILSRGYFLFALPLCVISLILSPIQRRWRTAAVFTGATAIVLAGWMVRNWVIMGKPVLSTQTEHFYLGNNQWARGSLHSDIFFKGFDAPQLKVIKNRYPHVMNMSEIERSEMWSNEAMRIIKEDPKRFAWLLMRKTIIFWMFLRTDSIPWYKWHYLYGFALLFAAPMYIVSRRWIASWLLLLLSAPVIGVYISTLLTYSYNRYRFTIEPFVFLLGAIGYDRVAKWLR